MKRRRAWSTVYIRTREERTTRVFTVFRELFTVHCLENPAATDVLALVQSQTARGGRTVRGSNLALFARHAVLALAIDSISRSGSLITGRRTPYRSRTQRAYVRMPDCLGRADRVRVSFHAAWNLAEVRGHHQPAGTHEPARIRPSSDISLPTELAGYLPPSTDLYG